MTDKTDVLVDKAERLLRVLHSCARNDLGDMETATNLIGVFHEMRGPEEGAKATTLAAILLVLAGPDGKAVVSEPISQRISEPMLFSIERIIVAFALVLGTEMAVSMGKDLGLKDSEIAAAVRGFSAKFLEGDQEVVH